MKEKYTILVVEDEAPIRRNLCRKLERFDRDFRIAGSCKNGRQALEFLKNQKTDFVLTDIKMPVMDGLQLVRELKSLHPDLLVAIVSGYNDFEYAREAIQYQVTDYLPKPVGQEDLDALMDRVKGRLDQLQPALDKRAEEMLEQDSSRRLTKKICLYLDAHYTENISVADVAAHFGCSQEQLSRIFKKERGVPLQHYLIDKKIREAGKLLLAYQDLDIRSIGELVGYPDPYYFSRIFKKYAGCSPAHYRQEGEKAWTPES